ncbi:MAG: DUF3626 domain-containing protein [Iphinoe sp. HA4291-MV1]|jgi:hypothetical protein|nr:DUF3626 domain-containing protein [Iphinoe sp. HA4291-MV1]
MVASSTSTLRDLLLGGSQGLAWLRSLQTRNDYVYVKKIIRWNGIEIGLEYLPSDSRFGKKLRFGYGHFRRFIGEDGEALDCYVSPVLIDDPEKTRDRPIFRIKQLADDGDFDEWKYILGSENLEEAQDAYLSAMPARFFGGIEKVSLKSLVEHRREDDLRFPKTRKKKDSVTLSNLAPEQIRQDFALGLLDRVTALQMLGYGDEAQAIALRYNQELTVDSKIDPRNDDPYGFASRYKSGNPPNALAHSITPITSKQDLASIKKILEGLYTKGFSNKISKIVAGVNTEKDIVGVFEDRASPFLVKRLRFQISQDGAISYELLNPRDVEKIKQDTFDRQDAKNCKKGIPCKGTCISANKKCLGTTTIAQQTTVATVVGTVQPPAPATTTTKTKSTRKKATTTAAPTSPPPTATTTTTKGRGRKKAATPSALPPPVGFVRSPSNPIKTNDTELSLKRTDLEQRFGKKLVDDAESNVKRILDDPDTNVHIRVSSSSTLELILGSRFKTSAELGIDTHTIPNLKGGYQDARNRVEAKVLGYDEKTTQPGDRPIYGYLAGKDLNGTSHADVSQAYGSITVRLKPEAKERTTFTGADSFKSGIASDVVNQGNPPPPNAASLVSSTRHGYDKDKLPSHYPSFYADKSGDKGQLQAAASARNIDDLASNLAPTGNRYIEAQVHGGIRPQDIGEIHFEPRGTGDKPTAAIAQFAKDNKVDLYVGGRKLSTQDLDNIIAPAAIKDLRSGRFADLQKAIDSDDFDTLGSIAVKIHQDAQKIKLAPGESDNILKQLYKDSGFDALPQIKTETDMDNLARSGKVLLTRGLSGASANTFADQFRKGDYFVGNGIYGNGTYVGHSGGISRDGLTFHAKSSTTSQRRAWSDVWKHNYIVQNGATLRMALTDDAKVVTGKQMKKDMDDIEKKIDAWEKAALQKTTTSAVNPTIYKKEFDAYKKSLDNKNAVMLSARGGKIGGMPVTYEEYSIPHKNSQFGSDFQITLVKQALGGTYRIPLPDGTIVDTNSDKLSVALRKIRDAYADNHANTKAGTGVNKAQITQQAIALRDLFGLPPNGDAGSGSSGRFAVMRGIDAIALNNSYEPKTFMNLLNRGKVIVQDTNLDYSVGIKKGVSPA